MKFQTKNFQAIIFNIFYSTFVFREEEEEEEDRVEFDELLASDSPELAALVPGSMVQLETAGQPIFGVVRYIYLFNDYSSLLNAITLDCDGPEHAALVPGSMVKLETAGQPIFGVVRYIY